MSLTCYMLQTNIFRTLKKSGRFSIVFLVTGIMVSSSYSTSLYYLKFNREYSSIEIERAVK